MRVSFVRAVIALAMFALITGCRRGGERVLETGKPANYLTCAPPAEWPAPDTQEVGSDGDTLRSGNNTLIIQPGTFQGGNRRRFILAPVQGDRVGVEITMSAQGKLSPPAILEIDMRCDSSSQAWSIWRIKPNLNNDSRSQRLETTLPQAGRSRTNIDTTSAFMIAN